MDSNLTIQKINHSRYNLKKYLDSEWDISVIKDYSDKEIDKLYKTTKPSNSDIHFGYASGCNFSLYHKRIPSHRVHIIYYNFPEIGNPSVKVTKTCSEKLSNLYKDEIIEKEDSLIVILYRPVPENLGVAIEALYSAGQEELLITGLSENIQAENNVLGDNKLTNSHFKNIHIFHLDSLSVDITQHEKVPQHIPIRERSTIDSIMEKCNARLDQFPIILRTDPMAKRLRLAPGDMCKILRKTNTAGEVEYFRVCK